MKQLTYRVDTLIVRIFQQRKGLINSVTIEPVVTLYTFPQDRRCSECGYKPLSRSIPMETIASFRLEVLLELGWILSIHFFPPDEILLSSPGSIFSMTQEQ